MNVPGKICKNCFSYIGKTIGVCPVCGYLRGGYAEPSVLPRGTSLGNRYILGGNIGRGGFGITYLAYDTLAGRTVAVKEYFPAALARRASGFHVIPNSEKSAEQFNIGAEKFFDEAELVRRFNGNPNIVSIYDCFYENNTAYFIMEYLNGITLENYVQKYGVLNSAQALYIADKLTMALLVLHSGEVLHRDISPDNVMLCRDGSVKLIDFGAARQFLADGKAGYTVIMKTGFSPAEQYSQSTDTDIRADIYSTGTLLYYALTGNIPESPYKRMENDSAFVENPVGADSGLWAVIGKAAAVSPSERFKSAEEFRSALAKLEISAAAVAVPEGYNPLKTESGVENEKPKKHLPKAFPIAICAAVLCAAAFVGIAVSRINPAPQTTEIILDSEYKGHFNIGGMIPSEELKKFGGDVEITIYIDPYEDMPSDEIHGVIPVNSDDHSMLEYLSAPGELWADENGWINIEKGDHSLSLVLSREGIESLGGGGLGFETYNLIVTSAVLKHSEKQNELKIYDFHKERNAPYSVYDNKNGKIITLELDEYRVTQWADFESQSIPKSAFYIFDGDVKVTVTLEDLEGGDNDHRDIYVRNCGFCFNVIQGDVLVPLEMDGGYLPVSRDEYYGIHIDKNRRQLILIIPQSVKEKMSSGIFFQCMNVRTDKVCLEAYNGEYGAFVSS